MTGAGTVNWVFRSKEHFRGGVVVVVVVEVELLLDDWIANLMHVRLGYE